MGSKKILHREWFAIQFCLALFASLHSVSKISQEEKSERIRPLGEEWIQISFEGAVKDDRPYLCRPGTTLRAVVKKAEFLPTADCGALPLKKSLLVNQTFLVREKRGAREGSRKISLREN